MFRHANRNILTWTKNKNKCQTGLASSAISIRCRASIRFRKSVYLISLLGHVSDKADLQLGTVLRYSTSTFQVDNQKNSVPRRFQKLYSINRLGNMFRTIFKDLKAPRPTEPILARGSGIARESMGKQMWLFDRIEP